MWPDIWFHLSFIGFGELDSPAGIIVALFMDHSYEFNIYHLLQFWDLLWLENGNRGSQS
jgi:hypothetical protein